MFICLNSFCGDAGAVKRAGLKILWLSACEGSNPSPRIKRFNILTINMIHNKKFYKQLQYVFSMNLDVLYKSKKSFLERITKPVLIGLTSTLISVPSLSFAGGEMTCYYPKTCREIISSEYSTGGGDKVIHYVEVDCKTNNGEYIKYIDRIGSIGGFFGLGRFTQPDKIYFKQWEKDELECK